MKDDGGPAFPVDAAWRSVREENEVDVVFMCGMSLRDWFAGMASLEDIAFQMNERAKTLPEARYDHAEMMIAEKRKREKPPRHEGGQA